MYESRLVPRLRLGYACADFPVKEDVDGHPLKEKFAAVAWEQWDSTRDTALATLNKLGASSEIAYLSKIKPVLDEAAAGLSEKLSNAAVTKPGP